MFSATDDCMDVFIIINNIQTVNNKSTLASFLLNFHVDY